MSDKRKLFNIDDPSWGQQRQPDSSQSNGFELMQDKFSIDSNNKDPQSRQDALNKTMEELVKTSLNESGDDSPGKKGFKKSEVSIKGSLLGGISKSPGLSGLSGSRDRSKLNPPPGASIPGLEQARAEREKQSRFGINQGGRFAGGGVVVGTTKGSPGSPAPQPSTSSTGGGSSLRKGLKF
jgi:hypothetical protein